MGEKVSLPESKKPQIVILHKDEFSERKNCRKVACSKTVVNQVIARFRNFGLYQDKKRRGRQKKAVVMTT